MAKFVETEEFEKLNVGFELDESGPSPTEQFILTYAERALWRNWQFISLISISQKKIDSIIKIKFYFLLVFKR